MKDRLFNSLDANTVQQYRLRKPDCPFKQTQAAYAAAVSNTRAKSNSTSSSSLSQHQNQQHQQQHGHQYQQQQQQQQQHKNPLLGSKQLPQAAANFYNNNNGNNNPQAGYIDQSKPANAPFMPAAPLNHPMPTASIYSAAAANANPVPFRSATPVGPPKFPQQPSFSPPQTQPQPQAPTGFFAPSNNTSSTNGQFANNQPLQSKDPKQSVFSFVV
jgi:hypothetical protein